jgi:uncharacterized membrane protein AbrB (regulator of aidB expression)
MPRSLKIILFAAIGMVISMTFFGKLIETKSIVEAALFVFQILAMMLCMLLGFAFFAWIGNKIFKDSDE